MCYATAVAADIVDAAGGRGGVYGDGTIRVDQGGIGLAIETAKHERQRARCGEIQQNGNMSTTS